MKVKVSIEINVFSTDTVPALLQELVNSYERENITGKLLKDDNDFIEWKTKIKQGDK